MGSKSFSFPASMAEFIKKNCKDYVFVETGTFQGGTVDQVRPYVKKVLTCEPAKKYYDYCVNKYKSAGNSVSVYNENSLNFLAKIDKSTSTVYWIDSHYKGGDTYGKEDPCPLLDELSLLAQHIKESDLVLIDDARLFVLPNPAVEYSKWPNLIQICKLADAHGLNVCISEDVICLGKQNSQFYNKFIMDIQQYDSSWNMRKVFKGIIS